MGAVARASPAALLGVALLLSGLVGLAASLIRALPPAAAALLAAAALGAALVARELSLTDEVICGISAGDVLAYLIQNARSVCYLAGLLLSLPNVSSGDLAIIWRGSVAGVETGATQGHEEPAAPELQQRGLALARQWLQRPDLRMGLGDQLRLYGLYQRGREEPCADKPGGSWLERAKSDAEQSYADLSPAVARARLAQAVAEADPLFVAAHPETAMPRPGDQTGMLLSLTERRLPHDLAGAAAAAHRRLFAASLTLALAAMVGWARRGARRPRAWLCAALLGMGGSSYALALVHGLPLAVHAVAMRLLGGPRSAVDEDAIRARLRQYAALLLVPRATRSVFAQ